MKTAKELEDFCTEKVTSKDFYEELREFMYSQNESQKTAPEKKGKTYKVSFNKEFVVECDTEKELQDEINTELAVKYPFTETSVTIEEIPTESEGEEYTVTFYLSMTKNVVASNPDEAKVIAEDFVAPELFNHPGLELDNVEVEKY